MNNDNNNPNPVGNEGAPAAGPAPAPAAAPAPAQDPQTQIPSPVADNASAAVPASNPTADFARATVGTEAAPAAGAPATGAPVAQGPVVPNVAAPVAQPYGTTASVPAGKKGISAGKIIAIAAIFLVLVGGGLGAFFFYRAHESNERVLSDAIKNFIARESAKTVTTIDIESDDMTGKISLDASTDKDNESSMSLNLELGSKEEDMSVNGKLEAIRGKDALYVRIADYGNIADLAGELSGSSETQYQLESVFNTVGTGWYEIPYSELGDSFNKSMDCVNSVSDKIRNGDFNDEIFNAYEEHKFIEVDGDPEKKDGYKLYKIKVNEEEADKFSEKLEDSKFAEELTSCMDDMTSSMNQTSAKNNNNVFRSLLGGKYNNVAKPIVEDYDFDFDEDEYEFDFDDDFDYDFGDDYDYDFDDDYDLDDEDTDLGSSSDVVPDVYLGITPWTHNLVRVEVKVAEDDTKGSVTVDIQDAEDVKAPDEFKTFDDLQGALEEAMNAVSGSRVDDYASSLCTDSNNYSGYGSYSACKDAISKHYGGSVTPSFDPEMLDSVLNNSLSL